ncbi:glycosyltransferase family 9 protein [Actinomadura rugatobispora]|uniref:Glycosyltransferase family 9 protein n=1 Tax=Actinomadura rugatobispora TaxID=1994 RepID=A0ABW1A8U0_9ACTN|nr:glycosyltransferase family 9 protein [Actinomadura rugatobispora]
MAVRAARPPRALALRALGLGDLLTAVPALRALRRGLPGWRVTLAAPRRVAPIALLCGAVDDVFPACGLGPLPPPDGPVELAVNLHGCGPQSHRLLQSLRPRQLIAFANADTEVDGPAWNPGEHETARWCRLVEAHGFDADPADLDLPRPPVASPAPGTVVIHPGAGHPSRRWPAERYGAVAAALRELGERVVITGGPDESRTARRVAVLGGLGPAADLSGRTGPLELAALVARARLVICGDTGAAHLATAYRTPSVLLFGPTPPALWGPPPERTQHLVLWSGRRGDPHGPEPDPGLLDIPVDRVVETAARALQRPELAEGGVHDETSARGRDRGRGLPRIAPVRNAAGPRHLGGLPR